LPDEPAGTILRSEPIDGAPAGAAATRVLYLSTDPNGTPIAVSGIVVVPEGAAPAGGRPVVAWAHGTSGVVPRCAPSLQPDANMANIPELASLLEAGAIVVATDYPGLGTPGVHPYLVAESEGRAVLDSIRAGRALAGGDANTTATIYGHSQGGHSTLFAAELAPSYAPELDVVGAAAMAPPTNLGELLVDDEGEAAGVVLSGMAIYAWSHYYPDTPARAIVHAELMPSIDNLAQGCIFTNAQNLVEAPDVVELRDRFLSTDPVNQPQWKPHFAENSPATAPLPVPLLVAQGTADEIVRPSVTASYVSDQCSHAGDVEFRTYAGIGHFEVRTTAAPDVRDWLLDRIGGQPTTPNCASLPSV
jgi:hypothetical protein